MTKTLSALFAALIGGGLAATAFIPLDASGPVMTSMSATPTSKYIYEAKTVTCAATVVDAADGVQIVGCNLVDPAGEYHDVECTSRSPVSGSNYSCTIDFDEKYAAGAWQVTQWSKDFSGNRTQHVKDSTIAVNYGGLTYDSCAVGDVAGGEGLPIASAIADNGDLWIQNEFGQKIQRVVENAPTACQATKVSYLIPKSTNNIYFNSTGPCSYKPTSDLGEGMKWDSVSDTAYFSMGGSTFGDVTETCDNRSRIGNYDPDTSTFTMYNLPGTRNEVFGFHYDADAGGGDTLIVAAECGWYADWGSFSAPDIAHEGAIIVFDPATVTGGGNTLENVDWDTTMDPELCTGGQTAKANDCYQRIELGNAGWDPALAPEVGGFCPAHVTEDANGDYWFTNFWGSTIMRLELSSETITSYQMPATRSATAPGITVGGGPWEITVKDGYVYFNEFFDCSFGRMLVSDGDKSECETLTGGENTCVEWVHAEVGIGTASQRDDTCHTFDFDSNGVLWFNTGGNLSDEPGEQEGMIGFIDPDWTVARLLGSEDHGDYNPNVDESYSCIAIGTNDTIYNCAGPGRNPNTPGVGRFER